jgi:quinol monooxygenase YgiN
MTNVWTHGMWTVKPGREDEFVRAWHALARDARAQFGAAGRLLRDRDDPRQFIAFGTWPDIDALARFRSSDVLRERAPELDELVDGGEARLLEEVGVG